MDKKSITDKSYYKEIEMLISFLCNKGITTEQEVNNYRKEYLKQIMKNKDDRSYNWD